MFYRRLLLLAFILLLAVVSGCDEDGPAQLAPEAGPVTEERLIADIHFIKNTYFFFDNPNGPFYRPQPAGMEVWQSVPDTLVGIENLNVKRGRAWLDQSARGDDIRAGMADLEVGGNPPFVGPRNFKLLTFPNDFRFVVDSFDDSVIGIELLEAVPENEVLGARYINALGDTIGDIGNDVGTEENPINIELIKNANQKPDDPDFGPVWDYMLRIYYNLGLTNIDAGTLDVQILENTLRLDPSRPDGSAVPWLRIFGLDQTDETGIGPPDDRIDLGTGLIDFQRGLLRFPILRAFDPSDDSVMLWTDGEFSFQDLPYIGLRQGVLYDEFLVNPAAESRFSIRVRAVVPASLR